MSLIYKPHTFTVETASQKISGNDVDGRTLAAPVTLSGQLSPIGAELVYQQYDLQLNAPFQLLCDLDTEPNFTIGSKVTYSDRVFYVRAFRPWLADPETDCYEVILTKEKP